MFGLGTGERGRVAFWWLIGVLAASGVAMAFVVAFGEYDSIGFSVVWRVFVADLALIAALAAQHTWLRRTIWIGAGIGFVMGIVNALWADPARERWYTAEPDYQYGNPDTGWSPWDGLTQDIESAIHISVFGLVLLGFISLAYRWLRDEPVLRMIYFGTFGLGILSILLASIRTVGTSERLHLGDGVNRFHTAIIILALTGAAIVIIAAFVQRRTILANDRRAGSNREAPPAAGAPGYQTPVDTTVSNHGPAIPGRAVPGQPTEPRLAPPHISPTALGDSPELRALVRSYVEEYLREREQYRRE
ncbi:hypothetical protein D9V34_11975 [Mycetocola lacteus]|uniref:Uncharacterized protein n=1 Tax=Mycetocola lacteus TaxID=76637 RepID=A0A3L7ANV8_9MICO|nr:hypothetical protein [Mycetocola lacteus]RLP81340.1 hypothetical protein D9V34_11975 [Mycetocola lacteus]